MLVILALCLCILFTKVYLLCCLHRLIKIIFFLFKCPLEGTQVKNIRCEKSEKKYAPIGLSDQFACTNSNGIINYKCLDKLHTN